MKSAIVTGANGFIGKAVCIRLLEYGIKVCAIVRNPETMKEFMRNKNFIVVRGELQNIAILESSIERDTYEVFYHFAWSGTSGMSLTDESTQISNIQYTCNALKVAQRLGCKKFIFAGTINELELLPFYNAELFKPRIASIYGISKQACDFMCKTLATDMEMCYNTAIIGSCFGPGDKSWRIHNTFIKGMLEKMPPKLVAGDVWHDWVYIEDVAAMFVAIGNNSINMKNYYIGHRDLRKLKDILCDVRDILCDGLELRFGEVKDSFQIDYSLVDLNAVYEDTGYECQTDFSAAILETAEWVKKL